MASSGMRGGLPSSSNKTIWLGGRILLLAAAVTIVLAFVFAPLKVTDHSESATGYIKQLQRAEIDFSSTHGRFGAFSELRHDQIDQTRFPHYTFTLRMTKSGYAILAIPDSPRQKSFYSDESLVIRCSPGSQAANAESAVWNSR